jgi:hypothetical protein
MIDMVWLYRLPTPVKITTCLEAAADQLYPWYFYFLRVDPGEKSTWGILLYPMYTVPIWQIGLCLTKCVTTGISRV